jgi:hypothetical protein
MFSFLWVSELTRASVTIFSLLTIVTLNRMTAKLLLALASTVICVSESHGTQDSTKLRVRGRIRVRVTILLAVYRQSVRLGAKHLEVHGQRHF